MINARLSLLYIKVEPTDPDHILAAQPLMGVWYNLHDVVFNLITMASSLQL